MFIRHYSSRKIFLIITLLCTLATAYAFFAEFYLKLEPCPLCIAERVIIISIAIFALLFSLHNPKGILTRIYGLFIGGLSIFAIKIAAHHVWLIHLPLDQQPSSCGMPLPLLYQRVPLNSFLHTILQGDAECGKVNWTILGISAPSWVIILAAITTILSLVVLIRGKNILRHYK